METYVILPAKTEIGLGNVDNDSEIIGIGENIRIENGALVCDAYVIPYRPEDRASEIIFWAKNNTPFEASIEFTPCDAECEEVNDGETVSVDGKEIEGPVSVYRNVQVRAFSICTLGSVKGTSVSFLSKENHNKEKKKMTKQIAAQTKPVNAKLSDEGGKETAASKYPDLDELEKMFGPELGVRLFKDRMTLEEAKKVFDFNEKYGIVPKPEPATPDEPAASAGLNDEASKAEVKKDEPANDAAGLKAEIAKLSAANAKLTGEFAKLSAALTAKSEPEGVAQTFNAGTANNAAKSFTDITAERLAALCNK